MATNSATGAASERTPSPLPSPVKNTNTRLPRPPSAQNPAGDARSQSIDADRDDRGWSDLIAASNAWKALYDDAVAAWLDTEEGAAWRRSLLELPRRQSFNEWHGMVKSRSPECADRIGLTREVAGGIPRLGSFDVSPGLDAEFDDVLAAERASIEAEAIEGCMPPSSAPRSPARI